MKAFILSCFLAVVVARPDIGLTLQQQQSQHILPLNAHSAKPHVYQQLPQEHSFSSFASPDLSYGASFNGGAQLHRPQEMPVAPSGNEEQLTQAAPLPIGYAEDSYNMAHRASSIPHATGYQTGPVETKIHKHVYVHVPPKDFEDEDAIQTRVHHQQGPKQKHYKIVFIKAPSAPAVRAPIVAPPPQNEEKTLIYVLHKKPELEQDIVIPTVAPTKPSKPEVYFIKYKTKKEGHPVYGPPPVEMDPRHANTDEEQMAQNPQLPNADYVAPLADFSSMNAADILPPTTMQTSVPEQEQNQHMNGEHQVKIENFGPPTMAAFLSDDVPTTVVVPNSQYLPAGGSQAPIVVQEPQEEAEHLSLTNYGPPNRFFLKKRK